MWGKCCVQCHDRLESGRNDWSETETAGYVVISGNNNRLYHGHIREIIMGIAICEAFR